MWKQLLIGNNREKEIYYETKENYKTGFMYAADYLLYRDVF